jgi:transposase
LAERERTLFNLDDSIYLYDLTSTYFEGQCPLNEQAKRGYSRDKRPDCKQVVVGLVVDKEGFPKAHEVLDGNILDRKTVQGMLAALEKRTGRHNQATVVVDRGMAYDDNLQQIQDAGYHYIVASRQGERSEHFDDFEDASGFVEVIREVSPNNLAQKKSRVRIKRKVVGDVVHILCCSDGREKKDRAIREKHEQRLLADLGKLKARVAQGRLVDEAKIHEAIICSWLSRKPFATPASTRRGAPCVRNSPPTRSSPSTCRPPTATSFPYAAPPRPRPPTRTSTLCWASHPTSSSPCAPSGRL